MATRIGDEKLRELLATLRRVAEQAPPGPWEEGSSSGYGNPNVWADDGPLFATGNSKRSRQSKRAACHFVAVCNPSAVLVLCGAVEQLLADRQALVAAIDRLAEATCRA